jgi:hypothetical protein
MTNTDVFELADDLVQLKADKTMYENLASEIGKQISLTEEKLAGAMVEANVPSFTREGNRFGVDTKTSITILAGCTQAVADWIAQTAPELCTNRIHHKRRDAYLRESFLTEDGDLHNVPEELADKLTTFNKPTIRIHKAN